MFLYLTQLKYFPIFKQSKIILCAYFESIRVILFRDFLIFDQIFLSLQEKRSVIIGNKHGSYELLHEMPNELALTILVN